ncbi:MAG: hypothetical protein H0X27_11425 [Caulobacteraceae bacterium]|nr:hypothetical protein [Caulobacteraceae bacterium]
MTGASIPNFSLAWAYDAAGRPTGRAVYPGLHKRVRRHPIIHR